MFGLEKVLGRGSLLEIFGLVVRIASSRIVSQRLLAEIVSVALQTHVIGCLRVLERQRPAKNGKGIDRDPIRSRKGCDYRHVCSEANNGEPIDSTYEEAVA